MGILFLSLVLLGIFIGCVTTQLFDDVDLRQCLVYVLFSTIGTVGTSLLIATAGSSAHLELDATTLLSAIIGGVTLLVPTMYVVRTQ